MDALPVILTDIICRDMAWANIAFLTIDSTGKIKHANRKCEEMFRANLGQLEQFMVEDLMTEEFRAKHPAFRRSFFAERRSRNMNQNREVEAVRLDGVKIRVRIALSAFFKDGEQFAQAAINELE